MWDRSMLGMTGSELDLHEALTAMERALQCGELGQGVRRALADAVVELRHHLASGRRRPLEDRPGAA